MNILFLTNAYPDFESSCRGIFIKKMILGLKEAGYSVSVVTPKIFKGSPFVENQQGIKIYRFPFFSGNRLLAEYENIPYLRMIFYCLTGFFFAFFVALKERCQLIHAHWAIPTGLIGAFVKLILGKPLLVTVHGGDYRMAMRGSIFLRRSFLFVCKQAKRLTCVSEVLRKDLEKIGIPKEKISTFPMGIDNSFLRVGKEREEEPKGAFLTILSNRKLLPIYNVSLLIKAIPMVVREEPQTRFLLAGDGPDRQFLERRTRDLNVESSVQFLGWVLHEKMSDLLSKSDIYVSTSLDDGTSVSLLEAMASGAFPIVTDIASNREWVVNGKNGFLVSVEDERMLARRIIEAIRNRELLRRSRTENIIMIEGKAFWPIITENVKKIYGDLIRSKS